LQNLISNDFTFFDWCSTLGAFREASTILLWLLFVPFGTMFFFVQYILFFGHYGPFGFLYSLWHVIAFLAYALYLDYKRTKRMLLWKFETKTVTTKQIDEYVELVKRKKNEEQQ